MHAELLIRTERARHLLLLREQERSTCKSDREEKEERRLTRIISRVKKPSWETARRANICHVTESQNKYQLMTISEQATAFPELCSLGSRISVSRKSDRPASSNSPRNLARAFQTILTSSNAQQNGS
jgi:hypothetical protein